MKGCDHKGKTKWGNERCVGFTHVIEIESTGRYDTITEKKRKQSKRSKAVGIWEGRCCKRLYHARIANLPSPKPRLPRHAAGGGEVGEKNLRHKKNRVGCYICSANKKQGGTKD